MPRTYYDLGTRAPEESWRDIRSIRAEPPHVMHDALQNRSRRRMFQTGLEQAQQQFEAASRIGYESRPLSLFYGLSQAGRALAAASPRLDDESWESRGHGLDFAPDFDGPGLFAAKIKQAGKSDSQFARVSAAIGSPSAFESSSIGDVLATMLDYTNTFRQPDETPVALSSVYFTELEPRGDLVRLQIVLPAPSTAHQVRPEAQVGEYLRHYPALDPVLRDEATQQLQLGPQHDCSMVISRRHLTDDRVDSTAQMRLRGSLLNRGSWLLLPRTGAAPGPLHPLMSWWLVLYALSRVARYAPHKWSPLLELEGSAESSKIEFLLELASSVVPELVVEELHQLNPESVVVFGDS